MREPEEGFQSAGEEDEEEKKKRRVKEEKTDGEGTAVVESSRGSLGTAAEVNLGLTGENDAGKKRKKNKQRRDAEATEGRDGAAEGEIKQGVKVAVADGEDEEKTKKKKNKRRKDEENGGSRQEERTDEGKWRVEAGKSEEVVLEPVELQETRERKKKDRSARVGKKLETFEAGVLDKVSGNEEGRIESRTGVRLEEDHVRHGDGESSKKTETKRRKRDQKREDAESFSEQHMPEEKKAIARDERVADESSSHGSHDRDKRRKKHLEEENSLGLGEIKKKKKAKEELTGHEEPSLDNMSDRGIVIGKKLTMTAEDTAEDDNDMMRSSSTTSDEKKRRKKKKKKDKDGTAEGMEVPIDGLSNKDDEGTSSMRNADDANASPTAAKTKKAKKVNFSGHVEVFPSNKDAKGNDQSNEDHLVQGKRFSQEEDEMIRQAVLDYIEENQLGEDGLNMVLKCKSHPQVRHCWKEIGGALPWRPQKSVYWRAHTLFQRSESRKWEPEELDLVRRYYKENGAKWKEMADLLGKHRIHVKDTWRRIKLTNAKKGHWSQEEYQGLFDLVNMDLRLKAFEEKKTKHGMLRENISWGAVSKRLATRHDAACCEKWYDQLTSPLVTQGLWADTDDYHLIDELLKLDASCIEDVEWDGLLEERSGDLCLKRWKQMVRHIGGHKERSFTEQVELLATRYCPDMLQFRTQNPEKCEENVDGS